MLLQDSATDTAELQAGDPIEENRPGSLACVACGWAVAIATADAVPSCPNCGGERFREAPLFDRPTVESLPVTGAGHRPEWLLEARAELDGPGHYLAFEDGEGGYEVVRLAAGWTRIGRSAAADLRLEGSTVSRRHALVVLTDTGELRALDDRSLNGLIVNGARVEWATLSDGDTIDVGRYRLHVLRA